MKYTKEDIRVGDTWDSVYYKGSYAVVTGVYDDVVEYNYFCGYNDIGNYGDILTGCPRVSTFLNDFRPRHNNFSKIKELQKCIEKIKRS